MIIKKEKNNNITIYYLHIADFRNLRQFRRIYFKHLYLKIHEGV